MIGRSTRVDERASIKKSVIGKHCVIGKMAKIVGCVILDHCVINDGSVLITSECKQILTYAACMFRAKLDGCILGANTKIGEKAELSKCVTQAGYEVGIGGTLSAVPD